jgi:hypothetical protein
MMPTWDLTDDQVVELVKQLPAERRRAALAALAEDDAHNRDERMKYAEGQLRRCCAERGLDWDKMSEEQRETFVDGLMHEDRPCGQ